MVQSRDEIMAQMAKQQRMDRERAVEEAVAIWQQVRNNTGGIVTTKEDMHAVYAAAVAIRLRLMLD